MLEEISKLKKELLPLSGNERGEFLRSLKYYVYLYCEINEDNKRLPVYIGQGKGDRCLSHLNNLEDLSSSKNKKMRSLILEKRLSIDVLAYGVDKKTALAIESACIDLMGIDNLENLVRGQGDNFKRMPLNQLTNLKMEKKIEVDKNHRGVAILINTDYTPNMGDLELFEITRGIWPKSQRTIAEKRNAKFAYATHKGVIKEIYEIYEWVPAGTQQYFTRILNPERLAKCPFEFVGRKAPDELRDLYLGKLLNKKKSYGNTFIPVGYD